MISLICGTDSAPPPPEKTRAEAASLDLDEITAEIRKLYKKHNPSKLEKVDGLLVKYEGQEGELLETIREKYRVVVIDKDDL